MVGEGSGVEVVRGGGVEVVLEGGVEVVWGGVTGWWRGGGMG